MRLISIHYDESSNCPTAHDATIKAGTKGPRGGNVWCTC